jgi:hypothetical protein
MASNNINVSTRYSTVPSIVVGSSSNEYPLQYPIINTEVSNPNNNTKRLYVGQQLKSSTNTYYIITVTNGYICVSDNPTGQPKLITNSELNKTFTVYDPFMVGADVINVYNCSINCEGMSIIGNYNGGFIGGTTSNQHILLTSCSIENTNNNFSVSQGGGTYNGGFIGGSDSGIQSLTITSCQIKNKSDFVTIGDTIDNSTNTNSSYIGNFAGGNNTGIQNIIITSSKIENAYGSLVIGILDSRNSGGFVGGNNLGKQTIILISSDIENNNIQPDSWSRQNYIEFKPCPGQFKQMSMIIDTVNSDTVTVTIYQVY